MKFFNLYPHCFLVEGAKNFAIYDVFQNRIYRISESFKKDFFKLSDNGRSLQMISVQTGSEYKIIEDYAVHLQKLDYGCIHDKHSYSKKFNPILSKELEEKVGLHKYLDEICLEISSECLLSCADCGYKTISTTSCMCGIWSPQCKKLNYSLDDVLEKIFLYGINKISIQGGDPFLNKELVLDVIKKSKAHGVQLDIHTPGVNISNSDWDLIRDTGTNIVIPVFGINKKNIYQITSYKDTFKTLVKISKIKYSNIFAKVILNEKTFNQKEEILNWLKQKNINIFSINYYISQDSPEIDYTNEISKEIFKRAHKFYEIDFMKFYKMYENSVCWANKIAINLNGDILPCIATKDFIYGNVNNDSLISILKKIKSDNKFNISKSDIPMCKKCEYRYSCNTCYANNKNMSDSLNTKNWNCVYEPETGKWNMPINSNNFVM